MMNSSATANDSDIVKILIHLPIRICLILYFLALPFNEFLSEIFLWVTCIGALAYILLNIFSQDRRWRMFRLGGEGLLFLFLGFVVAGWYLNGVSIQQLYSLRWFLFLYLLTYIFDIFPGLNHRTFLLVLAGSLAAVFGILQTSIESGSLPGVINPPSPSAWPEYFPVAAQGFFEQREFFGIFLSMVLAYPLATLILQKRIGRRVKLLAALLITVLLTGIILSFSLVAWTAALCIAVTILVMNRNIFPALLAMAVVFSLPTAIANWTAPHVAESLSRPSSVSAAERRQRLKESLEVFKENMWFGRGFNSSSIQRGGEGVTPYSPAPNTYFELLASVGLLGFIAFMLFALSYLFMGLQLWKEIPAGHGWHRAILVGALAGQVTFHFSGLHLWTLGQFAILNLFMISLAFTAYLSERYSRGIVSDDYSL